MNPDNEYVSPKMTCMHFKKNIIMIDKQKLPFALVDLSVQCTLVKYTEHLDLPLKV